MPPPYVNGRLVNRRTTAVMAAIVCAALALTASPAIAFTPIARPALAALTGGHGAVGLAAAPQAALDAVCGTYERLDVAGVELCSHGDDVAPAASGASQPGPEMATRDARCIGNGRDGQRVEVHYVYGPSGRSASASRVADIRRWVGQVEWTVQESARRTGGKRYVRWETIGDDCDVRVRSTQVSSAALRDFETMVDELRAAGLRGTSRTYMLFTESTTYCGVATAPRDDDAEDNRADRIAGYARIDRDCWDTGDEGYHSVAAHELFHTLGAVQDSAPHATDHAHCTDEHDVMCYPDADGVKMSTRCRDSDSSTSGAGDAYDRLLDCRGDDYFNANPPSNSYLDRHWNTADSERLLDPDRAPEFDEDPVGWTLHQVLG